jgi:N,N'-diacetyllegionaminate synthase
MTRTIIIAEAGVNHNGRMDLAKRLVDAASTAGADFIKFQAFKSKHLVTSSLDKANYQKKSGKPSESQYEMLKKLELSQDELTELFIYCSNKKIGFMASAFDEESLKFILNMDIEYLKVPSGEITNIPYLRIVGRKNKKVILSTGMSKISEIQMAVKVLSKSGLAKKNLTILHCNTDYPTDFSDVNLNAMKTLESKFQTKVGYSDHTKGSHVAIAAVSLGASVIEKHLTLNKQLKGPDHSASIEPREFIKFVESIRTTEEILGSYQKKPTKSEIRNINHARKVIVASKSISKGEKLNLKNVTVKRSGKGLSPVHWDKVIGSRAKKNYRADQKISIK